jgi:hypothetical protein
MNPENGNTQEKTIILLGAGASKGSRFHLPVMNDFFRGFQANSYPRLAEYLESRFGGPPFDALNLEDVMTQIEIRRHGLGAKWQGQDDSIIAARRELDNYIRRKLDHLDDKRLRDVPDAGSCNLHEAILRSLQRDRDSIVSLNYDLVADLTQWKIDSSDTHLPGPRVMARAQHIMGTTVAYSGGTSTIDTNFRNKGLYLKLHGSLDWLFCPEKDCYNHSLFYVDIEDARESGGMPCNVCGSQLVSVIVPPAMNKSFELYPRMGLVWNLAFQELRQASRWILIGVSLPDSDVHLKWLLREAAVARERKIKLTVVNPCDDACERAKKLLGVKAIRARGLEEYAEQCGTAKDDDPDEAVG